MTIKRKTHLNLSGSHHTLDSDNGFIGGLLYVTGSVTASVGVSASLVQGTNGLFANLTGSISSTSDGNPFIVGGSDIVVNYNSLGQWELSGSEAGFFSSPSNGVIRTTGSLEATYLSASTGAQITGSLHVSGGITGSISGTTGGLPFIVAGPNITTSYNSLGQWTITGSAAASVAGTDTQVQFNQNGAFAASSSFTFLSGVLGIPFISGSDITNQAYTLVLSGVATVPFINVPGFFDPALVVETPVLMTQSLMLFDGRHDPLGLGDNNVPGGGIALANDTQFNLYSGSWTPLPGDSGGKDPVISMSPGFGPDGGGVITVIGQIQVVSSSADKQNIFEVNRSATAGQMQLKNVGTADFISGAVRFSNGSDVSVYSGSLAQDLFRVGPSITPNKVDLRLEGAMTVTSGSLAVNSGSISDNSFTVTPSLTPTNVDVAVKGTLSASSNISAQGNLLVQGVSQLTGSSYFGSSIFTNGIDIKALSGSVRTGSPYSEPDSNILSGALLTTGMQNGSVGKFRVEVIGSDINGANFISAELIVAASQSVAGVYGTFGVVEITLDTIGAGTNGWDININPNGDVAVTSSNSLGVDWYAQVTKKMILSGSGVVLY